MLLCAEGLLRSQERARLGSGAERLNRMTRQGGASKGGVGLLTGRTCERADILCMQPTVCCRFRVLEPTYALHSALFECSPDSSLKASEKLTNHHSISPKQRISTHTPDATFNVSFTRSCRVPTRT